ncbi:hypothetical protein LNQ03_08855 [Klebsiella pneumoniae subsp. pneumoniae]|nr:hypothetical protein [Klebsiella pneumoniae subsp. pneumoniae]
MQNGTGERGSAASGICCWRRAAYSASAYPRLMTGAVDIILATAGLA